MQFRRLFGEFRASIILPLEEEKEKNNFQTYVRIVEFIFFYLRNAKSLVHRSLLFASFGDIENELIIDSLENKKKEG